MPSPYQAGLSSYPGPSLPSSLSAAGADRDERQSMRLHEPSFRCEYTDPMTGQVLSRMEHHPAIKDRDLTIFFSTNKSRHAYRNIPFDRPNLRLPYPAMRDDDRGG